MTTKTAPHQLHHPSCLFVYPSTGEPKEPTDEGTCGENARLSLSLLFFPSQALGISSSRQGRIFSLKRSVTEDVATSLSRLCANLNQHFQGGGTSSSGKEKRGKRTALRFQGARFEGMAPDLPHQQLGDIFLKKEARRPTHLRLDVEVVEETMRSEVVLFEVRYEPAVLESVKLDLIPFVGCPVCPAVVLGKNCDLSQSKFQWFVSTNAPEEIDDAKWTRECVHEGYVFTPTTEHLGRYLRLLVLPFDSAGTPGLPFGEPDGLSVDTDLPFLGQFITSPKAIVSAPTQEIHHKRFAETSEPADEAGVDAFRLVCYNILASIYSTSSNVHDFFGQCPRPYLEPNYRFPLVHREVLAYKADIVCLQEVDSLHFERRLKHLMDQAGAFEGHHLSKLLVEVPADVTKVPPPEPIANYPRKGEGVAIFFRRDRFRLISKFEVDSLMLAAEGELPDLAAQFRQLHESGQMPVWSCIRSRAQGLLVCLLESRRTGRRLLVANTHLYFHPIAMPLRNLQCQTLRHLLLKMATENAHEVDADGKKIPLPILLAADLNTTPDSENYALLVGTKGNCDNDGDSRGPILQSAVDFPEGTFSNMVAKFKANLDAILYTNWDQGQQAKEQLRVRRRFVLPTEAEVLEAGRRSFSTADPLHASLLKPLLPDAEGGHTMPNSQFPSDHLALLADFNL